MGGLLGVMMVFYFVGLSVAAVGTTAAKVTFFGDREFYGEWWNSTTFDQFSRTVC